MVPFKNPASPVLAASVGFDALPVIVDDVADDFIEQVALTDVCPDINKAPILVNSGSQSGICPGVGPPGCMATMKSPGFDGMVTALAEDTGITSPAATTVDIRINRNFITSP